MPLTIPWAPRERYQSNSRIPELILEGGRIRAEGHLRSGAIWGNTLQQLGGIAGGAIQQYGEQKKQQRTETEWKHGFYPRESRQLRAQARQQRKHFGLLQAQARALGLW